MILLMASFSSVMLSLFFYGLGGWFFYHNVVRHLYRMRRLKALAKRINNPNLKKLDKSTNTLSCFVTTTEDVNIQNIIKKQIYINLIQKDVSVLLKLIKQEKTNEKKNLLLRTLALQLYEFYQDINKLYDKKSLLSGKNSIL